MMHLKKNSCYMCCMQLHIVVYMFVSSATLSLVAISATPLQQCCSSLGHDGLCCWALGRQGLHLLWLHGAVASKEGVP